jgi:hypothetical protein
METPAASAAQFHLGGKLVHLKNDCCVFLNTNGNSASANPDLLIFFQCFMADFLTGGGAEHRHHIDKKK